MTKKLPGSKQEWTLKYMKDSVGTKEPIEYFDRLTDLLALMFERLDEMDEKLNRIRLQSALAIKWEPHIASNLIAEQVHVLRATADLYAGEIEAFKKAFADDVVTQSYDQFCTFWQDVLGYHPFLD